jgi:hypothetical protein
MVQARGQDGADPETTMVQDFLYTAQDFDSLEISRGRRERRNEEDGADRRWCTSRMVQDHIDGERR